GAAHVGRMACRACARRRVLQEIRQVAVPLCQLDRLLQRRLAHW
ncbi:hypothetical protein BN1708_020285, partial [Verticillium longisporum]